MSPAETAAILRQFNEWRRGDEDILQFDPREIGEAIDAAVEMIERLEAAEKERDALRAELAQLHKEADKFGDGIDWIQRALQAEAHIEQMERQEPVATVIKEGDSRYWMSERLWTFPDGKYPLYALPGAQPAQSVPELIESLRCACNYIDKLGGVSQQYRAMIAAAPDAKP